MPEEKGCTPKKAKHPRIVEAERQKELEQKKKTITDQEQEMVEKIKKKMKDPNLLVDTVKEVQKEVAGEEETIIAIIIVTSTRLVKNAIPESVNLFLSDKTGLGKDHVTKKTLVVVIPEDDHLHVTKMSKEAFTYWHAFEEEWTWDNKVIHLEDVPDSLLNSSTFKVMSSGGSHAVVVKDQKTIEIPINGKPCMILTSHHANPEDENLRRFRIGGLNDTKKQTRRIKNSVSEQYMFTKKTESDYILRSAVQSLDPEYVIIPFAGLIQHFFPDDSLMRTHYHCFLDYICGSALFHQYQREKTEDGKIIATADDYMLARMVLIYTTSNPKMIPMSREYRELLEILQENVDPMTVHDLFLKCDHTQRWLYRHLPNLTKTGLVVKSKKDTEDSRKPVDFYQFSLELNAMAIPTWKKIIRIVNKIYKEVVKSDNCVKCSNPSTEEDMVRDYICHALSNVSNDNERKEQLYQLTGLSFDAKSKLLHINEEQLTQMTDLSTFLRERDEVRYEKYYKEPKPTEEKSAQYEKIQEIRKKIEDNRKAGYKITDEFLYNHFDHGLIDGLTRSGQLIKQGNGEYVFGG